MKHKDVWVFIEISDDNTPENVGLELLTPAKEISNKMNQDLVAVVIGNSTDKIVEELKEFEVDKILVLDEEIYATYNTEIYANSLASLCEKYMPNTMFVGATNKGRDLAPRVAARLKAGLTADCTEISLDPETNNVLWSRPTFGGNLMATIIAPKTRPQIGTVRPGVFSMNRNSKNDNIKIIKENIFIDKTKIRTELIKKIKLDNNEKIDFKNAKIIIGVGRGIKNLKNFELIEELARLLNASIAVTRSVVDAGFKSHSYQVGQSGKTVNPDIYIAVGISGAIQHTTGIMNSKMIIAINKDPYANIFKIADYGIVGDLFDIIPRLIDEIKSKE